MRCKYESQALGAQVQCPPFLPPRQGVEKQPEDDRVSAMLTVPGPATCSEAEAQSGVFGTTGREKPLVTKIPTLCFNVREAL